MTAPAYIGLAVIAAAALTFAPSVIDRAIRNHRRRQARAALCAANVWLDDLLHAVALEETTPSDDPIYQQLCFEFWEHQIGGVA